MRPSFEQLCEVNPEIKKLLHEAETIRPGPNFCSNECYYGRGAFKNRGFKKRILNIVGWEAKTNHKLLISPEAYDVVTNAIWQALPPCSENCGCIIMRS